MKFFLSIGGGFALALAVYAGIFSASLGRLNSDAAAFVGGWYRHKEEIAGSLPSPRLLIVGGSNVLYGITARRIEEATGLPTVNFGTHGALSLDYLLEKTRAVARPGDIVLLVPEYELYVQNDVNTVFSDYVLGADPGYLWKLPVRSFAQWVLSASWGRTMERLLGSERRRDELGKRVNAELESKFNDRGDRISNFEAQQGDFNRENVAALTPLSSIEGEEWLYRGPAWDVIARFVDWCRANDVEVLASFPNTIEFDEYDREKLERLTGAITGGYAESDVPVLGSAEEFMYPSEDFFDSIYHLDREASRVRTDRMIDLLEPYVQRARLSE